MRIGWIKGWVYIPMHGLGELERGGESVDVHSAGLLGASISWAILCIVLADLW